jgi:hypothetical protein
MKKKLLALLGFVCLTLGAHAYNWYAIYCTTFDGEVSLSSDELTLDYNAPTGNFYISSFAYNNRIGSRHSMASNPAAARAWSLGLPIFEDEKGGKLIQEW